MWWADLVRFSTRPALLAVAVAAACTSGPRPRPALAPTGAEVRALWVVRHTIAHPDSARMMVRRAAETGFNTLIVQVRGRGDAYYRSRWEPPPPELANAGDYDALGRTIREARRRGLRVHAWINTHVLANADTPPLDSTHLVYRRPDLLAVPRALARELYTLDPRDPRYLQALTTYAQANRDHVEGFYLSPAAPEAREHIASIWLDLLERYDLDGLHFDYVRYPAPDYDYSRIALERYRAWILPHLPDSILVRLAALEAADPLVYADSLPDAWDRFRRQQITDLVERIYYAVKKRNPGLLVSAAVFGNAEDAFTRRFQPWQEWLRRGILDVACPMAYTTDTTIFQQRIRTAAQAVGGARVWAGIAAYRNTVDGTAAQITIARGLGAGGVVLFSYGSMVQGDSIHPGDSYLRAVGRALVTPPSASQD